MPELSTSLVHRCGAVVPDGASLCTGCGSPLMVFPEELRAMTETAERFTGLGQVNISLFGVLASAYTKGWDDAMEALRNAETTGDTE